MWTFHDFPRALVKQKYGADITPAWLDRVRTSTVRLSNCTASFVSPAASSSRTIIARRPAWTRIPAASSNLFQNGFLRADASEELRCGTQFADVLMAMENVTAKVERRRRDLDDQARERCAQEDC